MLISPSPLGLGLELFCDDSVYSNHKTSVNVSVGKSKCSQYLCKIWNSYRNGKKNVSKVSIGIIRTTQ